MCTLSLFIIIIIFNYKSQWFFLSYCKSFTSIYLYFILYLVKLQRSKTRELIFEKEQQSSNEEIYTLMFKQQSKLEEGSLEERFRISEEYMMVF